MPFTLTFHSLAEKVPQHEEKIVFFDTSLGSFESQSSELKFGEAFYVWEQVDENGITEGNSCTYSPDDGPEKGWELYFGISYEDYGVSCGPLNNLNPHRANNLYWCSLDEFWNTFPAPYDSARTFTEIWRS